MSRYNLTIMKISSLLFGKTALRITVAALIAGGLSSCLPLAAGAAGGYILRDSGHKVQSPVTDD